jgi:hypothetical protein
MGGYTLPDGRILQTDEYINWLEEFNKELIEAMVEAEEIVYWYDPSRKIWRKYKDALNKANAGEIDAKD